MKVVARMELKPGMITAEDVLNYKNEIIVSANTKITDTISRLGSRGVLSVNLIGIK